MTVHELEVTRPDSTVQEINFPVINGSPNPGTVQPLSVVLSGNQTVNLAVINADSRGG